jgi:hypothetical protein
MNPIDSLLTFALLNYILYLLEVFGLVATALVVVYLLEDRP